MHDVNMLLNLPAFVLELFIPAGIYFVIFKPRLFLLFTARRLSLQTSFGARINNACNIFLNEKLELPLTVNN